MSVIFFFDIVELSDSFISSLYLNLVYIYNFKNDDKKIAKKFDKSDRGRRSNTETIKCH